VERLIRIPITSLDERRLNPNYLYLWVGLFYFENVYGLRSRILIINHMNLDVNHNMQITEIAVTVVVAIIPFEVFPEKSVWSIPARQADDHFGILLRWPLRSLVTTLLYLLALRLTFANRLTFNLKVVYWSMIGILYVTSRIA
jgi:hypothetical protein